MLSLWSLLFNFNHSAPTSHKVEEFKQRIEELKKQKALLLAYQITKLDNCKISEKLKTVVSIYPYMTREEKSHLWHLLIIRIEAGKSLVSVYWRGGGKYTFKHDRLAKNLKVLNTKGRSVVAAGGECPCAGECNSIHFRVKASFER